MACWSVKAHLLGDDGKTSEIRRVSVPVSATYNQLYDKTKAVFPDLHNEEISLSWKGIKKLLNIIGIVCISAWIKTQILGQLNYNVINWLNPTFIPIYMWLMTFWYYSLLNCEQLHVEKNRKLSNLNLKLYNTNRIYTQIKNYIIQKLWKL